MPCTAEAALRGIKSNITLGDDVDEHDCVHVHVRMLPILPDGGQQADILREELEKLGWTRQEDGSMTKECEGGVTATLLPDATSVKIEAKEKVSVTAEGEGEVRVDDKKAGEVERGEQLAAERARQDAQANLDIVKEKARQELVRRNADRIIEAEPSVTRDLKAAVNETVRRSLTQRAGEMGSIESTSETRDESGGYGLEIVLRT